MDASSPARAAVYVLQEATLSAVCESWSSTQMLP
jgi:hypothetical protein